MFRKGVRWQLPLEWVGDAEFLKCTLQYHAGSKINEPYKQVTQEVDKENLSHCG